MTLVFTLWAIVGATQTPFNCNGGMYRVTENDNGSTFQRIELDDENGRIQFTDLAHFDGLPINAICYRPQDDLVYGLIQTKPYQLCRIDADYRLDVLTSLPLPDSLHFVSGDISPDGKYLVMLGFHEKSNYNLLARIDLTDPAYSTEMEIFQAQGSSSAVYCTDIAFHPTTNILFGFDHRQSRLVTVDLDSGVIDNTTYPTTAKIRGIVPSIFFDARGKLFGIGSAASLFGDRTLFEFDIDSGEVERLQSLNIDHYPEDACSCPYTVELYKSISFRQLSPCTNVQFTYSLVNRTDLPLSDLVLRDSFPPGFSIQNIQLDEHLTATVSGEGTNRFELDQLDLPIGEYDITIDIWLEEEVLAGEYADYATLWNTPRLYPEGPSYMLSDDPETIAVDDPTRFSVRPLEALFDKLHYLICPGDSLRLQPLTDPNLSYTWSTGATSPYIWVSTPGEYELLIESDCESDRTRIRVEPSNLAVTLGPGIYAEKGEPIVVLPEVNGNAQVISYTWSWLPTEEIAICPDCDAYRFAPFTEGVVQLRIVDVYGCEASAMTPVFLSEFAVYVPNAFSPNGDGLNDRFFVQGRTNYDIRSFRIFDRWGNQVFEQSGIHVNASEMGWNGEVNGKMMSTGVYVWQAVVIAKDGNQQVLAGDVQLVR